MLKSNLVEDLEDFPATAQVMYDLPNVIWCDDGTRIPETLAFSAVEHIFMPCDVAVPVCLEEAIGESGVRHQLDVSLAQCCVSETFLSILRMIDAATEKKSLLIVCPDHIAALLSHLSRKELDDWHIDVCIPSAIDEVDILHVRSEPSARKTTRYDITYSLPRAKKSASVNVVDLPDLAAVIPFCRETRTIYLIEQVRPALFVKHGWKTDLEVPAGFIDPEETAREAAVRELKEETGMLSLQTRYLCEFVISPGFTGEKTSLFLARVAPQNIPGKWFQTVDGELLKIRELKLEDLPQLLESNAIHNALTCLAMNWCIAHPSAFNAPDEPSRVCSSAV